MVVDLKGTLKESNSAHLYELSHTPLLVLNAPFRQLHEVHSVISFNFFDPYDTNEMVFVKKVAVTC